MELNIKELDYGLEENAFDYNAFDYNMSVENIPENSVPPKKIGVRFQEPAKKPQISYEDILSKMGMFVSDGRLHLMDNKRQQNSNPNAYSNPNVNNNYIYNKYFKEELMPQNNVRKPLTKAEYQRMLLDDILQRQRIRQIKSKKLLMPTTNINMANAQSGTLNKLFAFSQK